MKKRILLVSCIGLERGGVQAGLMSIVRNLSEKYIFDIILFTLEKGYYEEEFLSYGGNIYRIPNYSGSSRMNGILDRLLRIFRIYNKTLDIMKQNGPYHAIHCNNYYESAYCLAAAHKLNVPIRICHIHAYMQYANNIFGLLQRFNKKIIDKYATNKIACSEDAFVSMFGKELKPDVFINSYNNYEFNLNKYPRESVDYLNITQVGYFCPNKNQIFTLRVLANLKDYLPDVQLNLIGFDVAEYKAYLEKEIDNLGLCNNVKFMPSDTNIPQTLSKSTLSIIPSKTEGFCIVAVESQAMGVPVFASDTIPKASNAGGCIYLSLELGPKEWAKEILNWYEENKNVTFEFDCSNFEEEYVLQKYIDLYEGK